MEENVPNGTALCRTACLIAGAVVLIGAMLVPVWAQTYPSKPIQFILPYDLGGGADIVGRIIGSKLAEGLGQPVVLENRPGAGGNVGVEFVAKARPDGYTIVQAAAFLNISPSLYRKLNYDPIKDLAPISMVAQIIQVVLVRPSLPVRSLRELVEYARANPGKLNFSSAGIGAAGHLAGELLKSVAKIDMVHVPYKGAGPATIGLIRGEVEMMVSTISSAIPQIQAGKVRALAVLSSERAQSLPDVPTAKEAGMDNPRFAVQDLVYGVLAPAGTPRDIVSRLNAEFIKIAALPDTREKMKKAGVEPRSSTPEEYAEFTRAEILRWAAVIKEANIPRID